MRNYKQCGATGAINSVNQMTAFCSMQYAYTALLERLGPPLDRRSVGLAVEVPDLLLSIDSSTISNCQE
jgi:hypothetical protein